MTFTFILSLALLCSVSAPEASTLPSHTSDLGSPGPSMGQRDQDSNPSHGLMTYGFSHGLMTYGNEGSLPAPVDTLNHTTLPSYSAGAGPSSAHYLSSTEGNSDLAPYFRLYGYIGTHIYVHTV